MRQWFLVGLVLCLFSCVCGCGLVTVEDPTKEVTEEDRSMLNLVKTSITVETRGKDTYTSVTQDVGLATSGPGGVVITWESDKPEVIDEKGKVTRPASGPDVEVKLKATMTLKTLSEQNVYTLKVLSLADRVPPVPGENGQLTCKKSKELGQISLSWKEATDDTSTSKALQYLVYYSKDKRIPIAEDCEDLGSPVGTFGPGITSQSISGLEDDTAYYVNVVVKDENDNKIAYKMTSCLTPKAPDTTPPVPGDNGVLKFDNIGWDSVHVFWKGAADGPKSSNLKYQLYYSTEDGLKDLKTIAAKGRTFGPLSAKTIRRFPIKTLKPETKYFFNVVVEDESGNKALYTSNSTTTLAKGITAYKISGYDTNGRKINGVYEYGGFTEGRPSYKGPGDTYLVWLDYGNIKNWLVLPSGAVKPDYFHPSSTGSTPPLTGWHKEDKNNPGKSILAPLFRLIPQ